MRVILLSFILLIVALETRAQDNPVKTDTLLVPKGYLVYVGDTSFVVANDTVIIGHRVRMKEDPYQKSEKFYDSLQERASKSRITRELHELLIRKQKRAQTVDSVIIRSEDSYA